MAITDSGNLGAVALDAAGYRLWPAIRGNVKYLWELIANSDDLTEAKMVVRNALRGKVLANQLRRAAFFGLGLIVVGMLIGRYGYALQSSDPLKDCFANKASYAIRGFGSLVRGLGTLYAAFWLGIIVFKAEVVIKGLSIVGSAFDKARELLAVLSPDFLGLDKIITKGKLISEEQGEKEKNFFLSLFIWIITIGTITQLDSLLPMDTSIGSFIAFVCALIGIYAISVYFGKNHIMIAFWVNAATIAGLLLMMFFNSVVYAKAVAAYKDSDYYNSSVRQSAIERVKKGIGDDDDKKADKKLIGNETYEELVSTPAAKMKATARIMIGKELSSDRDLLGPVICADLDAIVALRAKKGQDDCDLKQMDELMLRANAMAHESLKLVKVRDCVAERANAKTAAEKKIADEKKAKAAAKEQQNKPTVSGPTGTSVASAGSPSPALAPTANPWTAFRAQHGLH